MLREDAINRNWRGVIAKGFSGGYRYANGYFVAMVRVCGGVLVCLGAGG